jgi:hypothetical protein
MPAAAEAELKVARQATGATVVVAQEAQMLAMELLEQQIPEAAEGVLANQRVLLLLVRAVPVL